MAALVPDDRLLCLLSILFIEHNESFFIRDKCRHLILCYRRRSSIAGCPKGDYKPLLCQTTMNYGLVTDQVAKRTFSKTTLETSPNEHYEISRTFPDRPIEPTCTKLEPNKQWRLANQTTDRILTQIFQDLSIVFGQI